MENKKHNYLYDIMEFWLSDEKYEYYLNSLFNEMEEVYDLKETPVIILVLEKYITSLKEEFLTRNSKVNKEYYLRLFNNLYNNKYYKHDLDNWINCLIDELKTFIEKSKCKSEGKAYFIKSVEQLKTKKEELKLLHKINDDSIKNFNKYLPLHIKNSITEQSRINLTNDEVVIFGDDKSNAYNYSYSVKQTSNEYLLRFHVLDITSIIKDDTDIYYDLQNKNGLDEDLKESLSLKKGVVSPSLTFELTINFDGKITKTNLYKSIVIPSAIVDKRTTLNKLNDIKEVKSFDHVYKLLKDYYKFDYDASTLKDIGDTFNHMLMNTIGQEVTTKDIPFIYKVQKGPNSMEVYNQINNLNYYLYYLDAKIYQEVYEIICNKNNAKARYSTNSDSHYGDNKRFKLDILKSFTYVGYILQQVLKEYYLNKVSSNNLYDMYYKELDDIVNYYNQKFYGIENPQEQGKLVRKKDNINQGKDN